MSFNSSCRPAIRNWFRSILSLFVVGLIAGCAGSGGGDKPVTGGGASGKSRVGSYQDLLRKEDLVSITFSGIATPPADQAERIKEDGTINLQYIGKVKAEGKTPGQLQEDIQNLYVPKYYQRLTVTVKSENRVFYVDGEVRRPDRFVYSGEITVLQAVAAAQGFTDFAARGRIELTRTSTGEVFRIDARKAKDNPKLDLPVIPGDRIWVPRRSPFGG